MADEPGSCSLTATALAESNLIAAAALRGLAWCRSWQTTAESRTTGYNWQRQCFSNIKGIENE